MSTYTVNGVTYSVETGLPVEVNEGPPSITSEKPVGVLDGSVVRNKNGTVKNYNVFGQTKPYELWSNEEGTSWSIREPESVDGGTGLFPSEITKSGGTVIVRDGVNTEGYENFLTDELYDKATDTIKEKIKKDKLIGVDDEIGTLKITVTAKRIEDENIYDPTYGTGIPTQPPAGSFGFSDEGKKQAQLNRDEYNYGLPELKFGAVDHILQRLSLRNLTYPLDADYGNTQDYMMINQFTYRPPNKDLIFPTGTKPGFKNAVDSFVNGVPQGTPKEKAIGLVKLPMPNTLEDSNNVSWGEDKLNALTAAATSAAMGVSADALKGIGDFLKTADQRTGRENIEELLRIIRSGAGKMGSDIGNATSGFQMNENIRLLGRTLVGSALLNTLQFQVSPETILARGAGVVPNNNLALLFNSPTLREFKFSWKMSPRSKEEAIRINNILRFFKQGMAPKKGITSNSRSGGGSYFLGTPNIFDLSFKTARTKNSFWEILDRNDSVMRIKTCACTGAAVNYTPEGMWNAYEKGQPVAITLTLRFNELEPIFDTDYDDNYFNYDPQRTDLLPVPMDAVGY